MDTATLDTTIATWTADPAAAVSTPTVTARAEARQAVIQAGPFTWRADLPPSLGGTNQAPSPTAMLLGALAGCAVVFVADTLAPQLGVRIDAVEATVACRADARGLLGIGGAAPDLQDLRIEVVVTSPDGDDAVATIAEAWRDRCPIYLAMTRPLDVAVDFRAA